MTAEPLSDEDVATALVGLANWEHQVDSLARLAPTDRVAEFRMVVAQVSGDARDHVATVETPNGVVLRVATPEAGGVTAQDVEIAARIEQAIEGAGSQSTPDG
ncbi:4a-hydroxytetrahydrobiopterin dehydratase [Murinocardiopsis flavida]|uniref:Putative pterin-4-alpha-carbinolamine dehydratase n=1 Tax=Murinocardiopsis flavida TaxID=645275 RepID=A0A2P8DP91_9ACTN|nr:4a-hydroxytetrahydrobiopterin dehydratase [Murinocardiopsis flavida]PSK99034.1 4a-hydroxytetrahydrobiopterin dehydratase [Murinocardiopsis flavida]